jgi:hypothetical protein
VSTTGTTLPSQIGASDLNRILTSGYINGEENMGYMKRAGDHIASHTKSPHFHRPSKYLFHSFIHSISCFEKERLFS